MNPAIGDYHLQPTSPCIDAGDPTSPLDPDGTITDMGAYSFPQPIHADFTTDISNGYVPLTVSFTDLSAQGSGVIDEWYWDFGDGNNSSLQNPSNEYLLTGYYTISLAVTNINDSTDTETKTDYITVYSSDPPAPPTDVEVDIIYPDAIISWSAVDTTIIGDPALIDGYVVRYNETGYSGDEYFYFLAFTIETIYIHEFVAQYSTQMFYHVIAIAALSREETKYLLSLNNSHTKMKWEDVKEKLKIRNFSK